MTSAWTIKQALIDRIARQPVFANRQVTIAHPGLQHMESECVFISGMSATDRGRALGKSHRRETLSIELGVVSEVMGDDYEDAEDRAWRMFNDVEDAILNDPSLDGKCLFAEITSFEQRAYAGDQQRACEITIVVEVTADKEPA